MRIQGSEKLYLSYREISDDETTSGASELIYDIKEILENVIENNIFDGPSGRDGKSRGYIFFRPMVYDLTVRNNAFLAPEETDSPSYGIIHENENPLAIVTEDNLFTGKIDKEIIIGK